ncbi:VWA domain-containing protein [Candidatus Woesearchaeota archaeon]|nr:MAG: VWA domain-containing protein [Candidatus Woesearchaeota archaeon]
MILLLLFRVGNLRVDLNDPLKNILLLAVLVALTIVAYLYMIYGRRTRATHFGNMALLEKVHGFKRFHINPSILIFKVIIISLLFLIATDTLALHQTKFVSDTDYVILLDASASMAKRDFPPSRLEAAKEIAIKWLEEVPPTTRIGLVAFTQDIATDVPLTLEREKLKEAIRNIKIDYAKAGTSIDFALNHALEELNNSGGNVTLLLLTDGTQEVQNETIALANARNARIYSFGIGADNASLQNESEFYRSLEFDFSLLQELSGRTGGFAYKVTDKQELDKALKEVTLRDVQVSLDSSYYVLLLIAALSILEFIFYSKFGGL